jgi:hypothetical protein
VCILAAIASATAKETFRTPLKELGQRNSESRIPAVDLR